MPIFFLEKKMARVRLKESEARILSLRIAASQPNSEASTAYIKNHITDYIDLTEIDLEPSPKRKNEQRWQQIVGNVVSHSKSSTSIFRQGHAERTHDGIRVTAAGLLYLNKLGLHP